MHDEVEGEAYYAEQEQILTAAAFRRLHLNQWVRAESSFVPIEWWDACLDARPLAPGDRTPLVVVLNAGPGHIAQAIREADRLGWHPDVFMSYLASDDIMFQ